MNNTFNIKRFGLLLKRQWLEFGKIYLISLLVVAGVIAAFYFVNLRSAFIKGGFPPSTSFREPLFFILGFLFITVVASTYFANLGQKSRALIDLMIPASVFEKFLSGVFFTAILSIFSYLLVFYLVDLAFFAKLRSIYESYHITQKTIVNDVKTITSIDPLPYFFTRYKELPLPVYAVPSFITSLFLLGSVYFNRFHYIKTTVVVMIFCGIWSYIIVKAGQTFYEGRIPVAGGEHFTALKNENFRDWTLFGSLILFTVIFWAITYIRLKEKEV